MYMLINMASKATKDPEKRHLCCSECEACEAFDGSLWGGEGGAVVELAFTDNQLQAVFMVPIFVLYSI